MSKTVNILLIDKAWSDRTHRGNAVLLQPLSSNERPGPKDLLVICCTVPSVSKANKSGQIEVTAHMGNVI